MNARIHGRWSHPVACSRFLRDVCASSPRQLLLPPPPPPPPSPRLAGLNKMDNSQLIQVDSYPSRSSPKQSVFSSPPSSHVLVCLSPLAHVSLPPRLPAPLATAVLERVQHTTRTTGQLTGTWDECTEREHTIQSVHEAPATVELPD